MIFSGIHAGNRSRILPKYSKVGTLVSFSSSYRTKRQQFLAGTQQGMRPLQTVLQRDIAPGHCTGTLHRDIAPGHCTGTLHRDIAQGHCTGTLHRDIAQGHCTGTLHRDIAPGHCTVLNHRNIRKPPCAAVRPQWMVSRSATRGHSLSGLTDHQPPGDTPCPH